MHFCKCLTFGPASLSAQAYTLVRLPRRATQEPCQSMLHICQDACVFVRCGNYKSKSWAKSFQTMTTSLFHRQSIDCTSKSVVARCVRNAKFVAHVCIIVIFTYMRCALAGRGRGPTLLGRARRNRGDRRTVASAKEREGKAPPARAQPGPEQIRCGLRAGRGGAGRGGGGWRRRRSRSRRGQRTLLLLLPD